ncbi:hypothetical protein C9374_008307 [Naegleria lovaniensis]|uniref:G-protein coupled receptors family 1 profile domain-containing protein n=1 Tax=Naegleria lovaniensis TaxID=51637 RepID=A0AA88GJU9_NAELO|nr:uncharacterized protein C9374_008307 [Naegleria lovaniensis]KAG2378420.1 hypothetical protein C9374_008307 [Naegleria lovaniensis]
MSSPALPREGSLVNGNPSFHPKYLSDLCKINISKDYNLQIVSIVICFLSIISSVFVFLGVVLYRKETKSPRLNILGVINIFGFIYCLCIEVESIIITLLGNVTYIYPLCQIQAFIANSSSLCLNTFSLCLTFFLFYTVIVSNQYKKLKSLYHRLLIGILVVCALISIPFFVFIFPIPVPGTNRYAELYGKSSKLWCDFANTPSHLINTSSTSFPRTFEKNYLGYDSIPLINNPFSLLRNSSSDPVESYWAIFFEIGFFYIPNTLILIINILLFVVIIVKIRKNSKMLQNHQLSISVNNTSIKPSISTISLENATDSSPSLPIRNPIRSKMNSTSPSSKKSLPSGSVGNFESTSFNENQDYENQEIVDENKPLLAVKRKFSSNVSLNALGKKQNSSTSLQAIAVQNNLQKTATIQPIQSSQTYNSFSFLMFGNNIKYSTLTQRDIDEYIQFLHSQSRTALYYIAVLTINWIVWIASRLCWEFIQCQSSDSTSIVIFVLLSIAEQCSGPRMSSILLSIIFGISEDTVSPSNLADMLQDVTCLRYFTTYCAERDNPTQSNENDREVNMAEYDNLVFFWFDMYQLKALILQNDKEGEERKKQISEAVLEICDKYFSETSFLKINSDIISNRDKNHIRTSIMRYIKGTSHNENDDDYSDSEYSENGDEDTSSTISEVVDNNSTIPKEDLFLLNLLKHPLKSTLRKMNELLFEFKTSPAFDELINVLRMKAVSQRRSLFKDILYKLGRLLLQCLGMCQVWCPSSHDPNSISGYESVTENEKNHMDHMDVQIKDLWSLDYSKDVFEYIDRVKSLKLDNRILMKF